MDTARFGEFYVCDFQFQASQYIMENRAAYSYLETA